MSRFAFAFYLTHWSDALSWPFHVCLHSLETRAGAASAYPRYLVFSGEVTDSLRAFCERHRLHLQCEPLLTRRQILPNKALMCRAPSHEVVCLTDTDIVFLADPTPAFEEASSGGELLARLDIMSPLAPWESLPPQLRERFRYGAGGRIWRAQYGRFRGNLPAVDPDVPRPGGGVRPFYFNTGVSFVPADYLRRLGEAWWYVCRRFMRDRRLCRPYTWFLAPYFFEQMSYALAIHREGIPWSVLPSIYNFIPSAYAPDEDLGLLAGDSVVMVHAVSPVRSWLHKERDVECHPVLLPLFRRVREIAAAA